jgi:hypothetical protein
MKKITKLWVKTIKSVNYKQIKNRLADKNNYCYFGVLCDLAVKNDIKVFGNKKSKRKLR